MSTRSATRRPTPARRPRRRGAALLMCLFLVFIVSSLVMNVLSTETLQLSAARNVEDYERALYLANAGVHEACAVLEALSPTAPVPTGPFNVDGYPSADDSYQYDFASGATANQVVITTRGKSGNVERSLNVTAEIPRE